MAGRLRPPCLFQVTHGSSRSAPGNGAQRKSRTWRALLRVAAAGHQAARPSPREGAGRHGGSRKPSESRWHTVFCLASGPSLTPEDCEAVRAWRSQEEGRGVIVTNTTFRAVPWADALYAMDEVWWRFHRREVADCFRGELFSHGHRPGVVRVRHPYLGAQGQNSGAGAIAVAHRFGARRAYLLGYDCQHTGGRTHWHGDHAKGSGVGNAGSVDSWPAQFKDLLRFVPGLEIINCSRATALSVFPRASLEDVLT